MIKRFFRLITGKEEKALRSAMHNAELDLMSPELAREIYGEGKKE